MARQLVTTRGFTALTRTVMDAAERHPQGRLVLTQEGGYSPVYVPFCGLATIETLATLSGCTSSTTQSCPSSAAWAATTIEPHQRALVDRVATHIGDIASPASA